MHALPRRGCVDRRVEARVRIRATNVEDGRGAELRTVEGSRGDRVLDVPPRADAPGAPAASVVGGRSIGARRRLRIETRSCVGDERLLRLAGSRLRALP